MKKQRHPIRARFETWLTRLGFILVPRMPRCLVVRLANFFGTVGILFSRKLRRIGMANLDVAFGSALSPKRKRAILRRSFQSFALVMLDAFWFSRDTTNRINRWTHFGPAFSPLFMAKPHICVTAHYGNWEVMGMAVTQRGFPLHSVAKPLKNPEVDTLFIEARHRNGQTIVKREGAIRTLLKILQQGGKVALVLDQNTMPTEGGRFFPFFGLPVLVSTAVAGLALKTKSDVFIGMMAPDSSGRYQADYGKEIPIAPYLNMESRSATDQLTLDITADMEAFLRQHPDYWLWTYKRWKFIEPDSGPDGYPFYARTLKPREP